MIDLEYLDKLLKILGSAKVYSFRENGFELHFCSSSMEQPKPQEPINTQDHHIDMPIDEASLPPDLRTDNINAYDTILNWSGGPVDKEEPLPGVNDEPSYQGLPADPP